MTQSASEAAGGPVGGRLDSWRRGANGQPGPEARGWCRRWSPPSPADLATTLTLRSRRARPQACAIPSFPASELLRAFRDFAAGSCHGQRDAVSSVVRHLGERWRKGGVVGALGGNERWVRPLRALAATATVRASNLKYN